MDAQSTFTNILKRGYEGPDVKLAQEWLNYHGFVTAIDSEFGPATEAGVKRFQARLGLDESGIVDELTQCALFAPIFAANAPISAAGRTLGPLVVAYARQHLAQHPIEIGGENAGPWVRLYMNNHEGLAWPWCAGFATFILRQAAQTLGVPAPHPYAFGCDYLAGVAKANGRFLRPKTAADLTTVKPGYLFLVRKNQTQWAHIGIVEAVQGEAMLTIEGNTNDDGSAEGYEVCRRTRGIKDKDYLVV
jgi:hypothetical protein